LFKKSFINLLTIVQSSFNYPSTIV